MTLHDEGKKYLMKGIMVDTYLLRMEAFLCLRPPAGSSGLKTFRRLYTGLVV
jgi:hypothetical protein